MNEEKLKKLLSTAKAPKEPANQWGNILNEIEEPKSTSFIIKQPLFSKTIVGAVMVCSLALVTIVSLHNEGASQRLVKTQEVESFLLADSYFSETEGEYSWVESL